MGRKPFWLVRDAKTLDPYSRQDHKRQGFIIKIKLWKSSYTAD